MKNNYQWSLPKISVGAVFISLHQYPGEGNKQWHFLVCRKQGCLRQNGWQVSFSTERHEVMHPEKKESKPCLHGADFRTDIKINERF